MRCRYFPPPVPASLLPRPTLLPERLRSSAPLQSALPFYFCGCTRAALSSPDLTAALLHRCPRTVRRSCHKCPLCWRESAVPLRQQRTGLRCLLLPRSWKTLLLPSRTLYLTAHPRPAPPCPRHIHSRLSCVPGGIRHYPSQAGRRVPGNSCESFPTPP